MYSSKPTDSAKREARSDEACQNAAKRPPFREMAQSYSKVCPAARVDSLAFVDVRPLSSASLIVPVRARYGAVTVAYGSVPDKLHVWFQNKSHVWFLDLRALARSI
jgi:hypothetical protein